MNCVLLFAVVFRLTYSLRMRVTTLHDTQIMAEGPWIVGGDAPQAAGEDLPSPRPMDMHSSATETEHVSALMWLLLNEK